MVRRLKTGCAYLLMISLVIAGLFVHTDLAAMPPHPKILEKMRQQGDKAGLDRIRARMAAEAARGVNRIKRPAPVQGDFRLLVILINFSNVSFNGQSTPTFYTDLLDGASPTALSMKKYYADMSGGKMNLQIDVVGPYTASNTKNYYGRNVGGEDDKPATLVWEAVTAAKNAGVDFSPYDNNGDGYVDTVMIIHPGPGEEVTQSANDIWSHAWELSSGQEHGDGNGAVSANGKIIDVYCIQPEYVLSAGDTTIGVFSHEFAHTLGLPDLYDTMYETEGVGMFSIMAGGAWGGTNGDRPTPFLAWEKAMLGWITVKYPDGTTANPEIHRLSMLDSMPSIHPASPAAQPIAYALFALGLFGLGGGCVWYRSRGGRIANLVLGAVLLLASAFGVMSCGAFFDWLGSDEPSGSGPNLSPVEVALGDIETSRTAIMVSLGDPAGKQYYFLENKVVKNNTWTEDFPGNGLLITHIHNAVIAATIGSNAVNDGLNRIHGVNVVEADNGNQLWLPYTNSNSNDGTASDLFKSRSFTPNTTPATFYYTGTASSWNKSGIALSKVWIENISAAGATMTFKYSVR